MRLLARVALPLALAFAPFTASQASAAEIVDWCYYHDIEVRVRGVACVGANYPNLPPTGTTTTASAEIIDWCYYHDIEARVGSLVCVGVNYPNLPPK